MLSCVLPFRKMDDIKDPLAYKFLPEDCAVQRPFPLKTRTDGNCFAHAASRQIFGADNHDLEIRVRIVVEGVVHKAKYLNQDYLQRGLSNFHMPGGPIATLTMLSGAYNQYNNLDDTELIYNADIFK